MIINIAHTDSLSPALLREASFLRDVFKFQAAQIVIEKGGRLRRVFPQPAGIYQNDVGQAIIVIVEYRHSVSGGFNDVLLGIVCSGHIHAGEAGSDSNVLVTHTRCFHTRRKRPGRNRSAARSRALRTGWLAASYHDEDNSVQQQDNASEIAAQRQRALMHHRSRHSQHSDLGPQRTSPIPFPRPCFSLCYY